MEWLPLVAAVAPTIIGAATTHFQPFVEPQAAFRQRTKLLREQLIEKVAVRLTALFRHARQAADDALRGDGRDDPDLIGDFTRETFRLVRIFQRLDGGLRIFAFVNGFLYWSCAFAVLALPLVLTFEETRPYVVGFGFGLIFLQVLAVFSSIRAARRLDEFEETT